MATPAECPQCGSDTRSQPGYVPGASGWPVTCIDDWHKDFTEHIHCKHVCDVTEDAKLLASSWLRLTAFRERNRTQHDARSNIFAHRGRLYHGYEEGGYTDMTTLREGYPP